MIVHMAQAVVEGNSHFYVKLEGDASIYDFALPGLIEIVGYQEGDVIIVRLPGIRAHQACREHRRAGWQRGRGVGRTGLHQ